MGDNYLLREFFGSFWGTDLYVDEQLPKDVIPMPVYKPVYVFPVKRNKLMEIE